jgi:gluconolactonase
MTWTFELIYGPTGRTLGGLAWDGSSMLASDAMESTIRAFGEDAAKPVIARRYTNRTNGIAFGPDQRLFGCQEGSRRVIQLLPDGSATTTTTLLGEDHHNHPYLLSVDKKGRAWFSDRYHPVLASGPQVFPYLPHQSVLRLSLGGRPHTHWHMERMTFDTVSPRGVALAPDEKTLYVAETDMVSGGVQELRAYPILDDDTLGTFTVLHRFGADSRGVHRGIEGMCVDTAGNLIACAGWERSGPGPLIHVFAPSGRLLATHPVPADLPLNCAFGGPGLSTLYVSTASGHLFRARDTGHVGHSLFTAR